jgi:hypothetical protein
MSAEDRAPFRFTPQIILGLCVIAFGVALTVDNLGLLDAGRILEWWPLGIVFVGLTKVLQGGTASGRLIGGVITFVGVALLGESLDVFGLWQWWPIGLIALGLVIVFKAFGGGRAAAPGTPALVPGAAPAITGDSRLSEFAFWSGLQRRVSSPVFRHADLTAIMGGIELDLRQASTAGGEAVIDVFVMWGGIEITVPPDWAVSNQVVPIMGGAEDKSTGTQASQNRLVLRGVALMGGIEVKT